MGNGVRELLQEVGGWCQEEGGHPQFDEGLAGALDTQMGPVKAKEYG